MNHISIISLSFWKRTNSFKTHLNYFGIYFNYLRTYFNYFINFQKIFNTYFSYGRCTANKNIFFLFCMHDRKHGMAGGDTTTQQNNTYIMNGWAILLLFGEGEMKPRHCRVHIKSKLSCIRTSSSLYTEHSYNKFTRWELGSSIIAN